MEKKKLETLVSQRLSIRSIAQEVDVSPSTIRYWLRVYGLKTKAQRTWGLNRSTHLPCRFCGESRRELFYGNKGGTCAKCHNQDCIRRQRETKLKCISHLGGQCIHCGHNKFIASLAIHHLDPSIKDVSFRTLKSWSWKRIEVELKTCILLCQNCHCALHSGELIIQLSPP